uniref:Methyltransferase 15, mitochondrial 12S rRNA N4-cytidine n=1 Tax=Cyprinus carpio carpio TaxID=630221 RepID=A0A9J7ZXQ3_CYPCA
SSWITHFTFVVLDLTFGAGDHSKAILQSVPGVTVVHLAEQLVGRVGGVFTGVLELSGLASVSQELVTSSCLIGLLFVRRYPDMPCAADVVNALDQQALASMLAAYGEERHTRKIVAAIAQARSVFPIGRTLQLASIVAGTPPH